MVDLHAKHQLAPMDSEEGGEKSEVQVCGVSDTTDRPRHPHLLPDLAREFGGAAALIGAAAVDVRTVWEMRTVVPLEASFTSWLYRPYVDLGPFSAGPLHEQRVELDYKELIDGSRGPHGLQRVLAPSFRDSLLRETGLREYAVRSPLDLPVQLRTERWATLCDYVLHIRDLRSDQVWATANLLVGLCLCQAVIDLVPPIPESRIAAEEDMARLAYARASASFLLHKDYGTPYSRDEFQIIADCAPRGTIVRTNAALQMVVQTAKDLRDPEVLEYWAIRAREAISEARPSLDEFCHSLLMSRFYRAASFLPQLRNNRQQVVAEMDLCQSYAEALDSRTEVERILAAENLHPLLESRTKEAIWLGDLELAEQRARRLTEVEPWDPKPWLELGEVLINRNKVGEAGNAYRTAARLGPPGTAIAWFMAGQCHEALDELDLAAGAYLAALKIDPEAITAAERLRAVARRLGDDPLAKWAGLWSSELEDREGVMKPEPVSSQSLALAQR